jgi:hypothetical protein
MVKPTIEGFTYHKQNKNKGEFYFPVTLFYFIFAFGDQPSKGKG